MKPDWIKNENEFSDYFILLFFIICFLGSLPSKITALRYFTFITAIINLFLGAVSFIQDASTKEIYQAAYHRGNGFYGAPFVTGTEDEKEEFNVRMFPNPATDEVFFLFGKALKQDSYWEIYDNLGKKVGSGNCTSGKEGFSVSLSNYAGGIYHVKLIGENGQVDYKELVVIH